MEKKGFVAFPQILLVETATVVKRSALAVYPVHAVLLNLPA